MTTRPSLLPNKKTIKVSTKMSDKIKTYVDDKETRTVAEINNIHDSSGQKGPRKTICFESATQKKSIPT